MARHISVMIPTEMADELAAVEDHLRWDVHVHNLVVIHTPDTTLMRFQATNRRARECIEALQRLGVGHSFGSMEIMDVKSVIPRLSNHPTMMQGQRKQREYNPGNSLTLEEIYETVEKGYHLTFEYLGMCSAASIVCAVGLVTNSDPSVVASMLLSPLMGPILGITLGTACMDWGVVLKALRNELIGVLLTLVFGVITGFIVSFYGDKEWETDQMRSRGTIGGLAPGVLIALPCGIALAISVTSADSTILVGVAIAAALLPPIVNAGLEFAFGVMRELPLAPGQEPMHLKHAANSFMLFLLNWVAIYFGCLLVFAIKRVQPRIYHAKPRADTVRESRTGSPPPLEPGSASTNGDVDGIASDAEGDARAEHVGARVVTQQQQQQQQERKGGEMRAGRATGRAHRAVGGGAIDGDDDGDEGDGDGDGDGSMLENQSGAQGRDGTRPVKRRHNSGSTDTEKTPLLSRDAVELS